MQVLEAVLLIVGVVFLVLAGCGVQAGRVRWEWLGWACIVTAVALLPVLAPALGQ